MTKEFVYKGVTYVQSHAVQYSPRYEDVAMCAGCAFDVLDETACMKANAFTSCSMPKDTIWIRKEE